MTRAKSQLALASLLTAASFVSEAQTVQLGGQVRLSMNQISVAGTQKYELRDNASRLSVRVSEDLGGGMKALAGLEFGLDADTGAQTNPLYRHSFVALQGALGTVALGRLDSANPTGSPLYSQVTAITSFAANDAGATAIGTSMLNSRNRTSNSLGYSSPSFGGFNVRARAYLRGADTSVEPEDAARSLDLGLNYSAGPWLAGLGYARDERRGGLKTNELAEKWQFGLRYNFAGFSPYALFGREEFQSTASTRRNVDYWMLGMRYKQGAHTVVFNVMQRDVQSRLVGVRKREQMSYQYALSKRSELQAFIDHDGIDSSRRGVAVRAIGAGIRHDF